MKHERSFISSLPARTRSQLMAIATECPLNAGTELARADTQTRFIYFPHSAVVSLSAHLGRERGAQIMLVGHSSLIGAHIDLGSSQSPMDAIVAVAGDAFRVEADAYLNLLHTDTSLERLNRRSLAKLLGRAGLSTVCVQRHRLGARLARLLLELANHCSGETFAITHESLAVLLGVRREGISLQAEDMQQQNLIAYRRGRVTVSDRAGLEKLACDCYALNMAWSRKRWRS